MRSRRTVVVLGALLQVFALRAAAQQEYLTNGQFDADINGWTHRALGTGGVLSWDGSLGSPDPGSLRLTLGIAVGSHLAVSDGCFLAPPGSNWTLAALGREEAGSTSLSCAVALFVYDVIDCAEPNFGSVDGNIAVGNDWSPVTVSYTNLEAVPRGVRAVLGVSAVGPASGACNFDNATLTGPVRAARIPVLGFSGLSALCLALAVCGAMLLRRRA